LTQKGTQDVKKLHELPREELERIFNAAPFVASLGIRLLTIGSGICETELDVEPRHLQQDGFVHAGVQATMADHTAGGAAATLIESGHMVLTVEFKINLLRAAKGQRLTHRNWCPKAQYQLPSSKSASKIIGPFFFLPR
jgi:uncharacterized protein (TIGR00369 family)